VLGNAVLRPGQNAARDDAIYVEVAITIRRPRIDVARVMFSPRYDTAWIGRLRNSVANTAGPLRAGVTVAHEWRWFHRRIAEVSEVVQHTQGRVLELATRLPFALRLRYELEGIPEGSIARIRMVGTASGALRFIAPVANMLLRGAVIRDLDRLKALLESGAWRHLSP